MQTRALERRRGYSRWMRWNDICRSSWAVGFAAVGNSKKPKHALDQGIAEGRVIKKKLGTLQSSPAYYAVRLPPRLRRQRRR